MNWPYGDSSMADLIRRHDWSATMLGPAQTWPERFKAVVEMVLESPLVSSVALGEDRLLIYNDAAARLYGDHHPAALGRPLGETFAESYPIVAPLYDRVFAGETVQVAAQPLAVGTRDGDEVFDAYLTPVRDAAGKVVGAHMIGLEIGGRLRADAALRDSEARQAFLLELSDALRSASDAEAVMTAAATLFARRLGLAVAHYVLFHADQEHFDIAGGYSDGRIPKALSEGSGQISDHGPGWGVEFRRGEAIFSDDHDTRPAADAAASRALGIRSGSAVPLIRGGRLVAIFSTAHPEPRHWTEAEKALQHDVAERTWAAVDRARAESALREREADLARVQEIGAVGGVNIDVADGLRSWRSPEYRHLHGLPPDTPRETHADWRARVHPEDRDHAERVLFAAIESDATAYDSEYRIVRPSDGAVRWIHARADIERASDGTALRLVGAHIDVTEQKHTQEMLRQSEERKAFLLELSDALRPLEDAADIERTAVDLLGRKLGASRAFYATIEADGDTTIVRHAFVDGVDSGIGRHSISAFRPDRMPAWRAGQITRTNDSETDPAFGDFERAAYASVSSRAAVGVPIVKRGRLVGLLAINQSMPRAWTEEEIGLIAEVADRIWLAIDGARSEAALHETEKRLQQFGEASQDVLWIRDAETLQWEYLTPAFETIYGLDREAALRGDNMTRWLDLIVPEDRAHAERSIARVRDGEWVTFEFRIRRPSDGGIRWLRNTDFPIKDATGKVVRIGGIGHDVTQLTETERALAAAENRQRALVEGMPQLVWRAVDSGEWTWASPQWTTFTGQAEIDSHGLGWLDPVHPDDREGVLKIWKEAIDRGRFQADYRVRNHVTGRYCWFQTRATPVRDNEGAVVEWLGTSTDVNDLRTMHERQRVLLIELQHRVRNILAIIRSIVRRSLDGGQSLQDYAQHLEGRVDALARTQVLLTRQINANVDLEELVRDELTAQAADNARIVISGPDVDLFPKAAEVVALAMHELATNALKYGAIAHQDATLRIEWQIEERDDERWITIIWAELGVPVSAGPPLRAGFGSELITRRVPYELSGHGDLTIKSGGVVCTISFPLIDRRSILETGDIDRTAEIEHDVGT